MGVLGLKVQKRLHCFFLKMVCTVVWTEWITYIVETLFKHFYLFLCKEIYINRCITSKLIIMSSRNQVHYLIRVGPFSAFVYNQYQNSTKKSCMSQVVLDLLVHMFCMNLKIFNSLLCSFCCFVFFSPLLKTFIKPKQNFFFLG